MADPKEDSKEDPNDRFDRLYQEQIEQYRYEAQQNEFVAKEDA